MYIMNPVMKTSRRLNYFEISSGTFTFPNKAVDKPTWTFPNQNVQLFFTVSKLFVHSFELKFSTFFSQVFEIKVLVEGMKKF